jgi:divalent metal cation (Fe/Co/Zn/Cd) transporter
VVGELGLHVSRTLPLERVAALKADVEAAIRTSLPNVEVTLTANPVALDDETLLERILLIASRRRLFVHHLGVQNVGGRKSVTLDLEVDGGMRLADAHEIASQLEAAIAADLGAEIEVETHIEPMEIRELGGEPAEPALVERIAAALTQAAADGGALSEIHDVRVRVGPAGHYVIFHCRADANLTVAATHDQVDALERALRDRFPEVIRIVGHAEPAR